MFSGSYYVFLYLYLYIFVYLLELQYLTILIKTILEKSVYILCLCEFCVIGMKFGFSIEIYLYRLP